MARVFDVVEYPSEMQDEIVHRFPETGIADLRIGSQVIVRESQRAVFFRDGTSQEAKLSHFLDEFHLEPVVSFIFD